VHKKYINIEFNKGDYPVKYFLITEKGGKTMEEKSDRILLVTTTDFKTKRRYNKGLNQIVVERVK
jgi:hypothetical protein